MGAARNAINAKGIFILRRQTFLPLILMRRLRCAPSRRKVEKWPLGTRNASEKT